MAGRARRGDRRRRSRACPPADRSPRRQGASPGRPYPDGVDDALRQHDTGRRRAEVSGESRVGGAHPPLRPLERDGDGRPRQPRAQRSRRTRRDVRLRCDALRRRFQSLLARPVGVVRGDLVYIQGHSSPGIYARAFVEGRLTEEQLDHFRREVDGRGLSSYPHPWLMPDFWQFATVSMGLGPLQAVYQARFLKYLHDRGIADTSGRKVWAFLGDGEVDEPESLAGLSLAAREKLDNLIFVINCNLQRLDGPVRGNG